MMNKMVCFDMDGTIADLYKVDNWLGKLRAEDASPYEDAAPMWDMDELAEVLNLLRQAGWEIRVITWLSMNSTAEYKDAVRAAKKAWLDKWGFMADHFHGVQYGATKADSVRRALGDGTAILVDDNAKVRKGWHLGETIDPTACNLLDALRGLLEG
ncbi:MAG: hypothetical protein NC218_07295 [Acetobacter sp.]|nr:hypothetical protein [Acetobacter sp.]